MLRLSHGFAWARNINITGIARYLADGWIYRYYQARMRYKNFFLQTYLNTSFSGDPSHPTRNLATGGLIYDRSKKFSAQIQHVMEFFQEDFRFVWGLDYFLTLPDTRGTILSDKKLTDRRDNNGNGEAGSPINWTEYFENGYYEPGEKFVEYSNVYPTIEYNEETHGDTIHFISLGGWFDENGGHLIDSTATPIDNILGGIADGFDNDGDCPGDTNGDGIECGPDDDGVDEDIDWTSDRWVDGVDNNGNGIVDESEERYNNNPNKFNLPDWQYDIEFNDIIINNGRLFETHTDKYGNITYNQWYDENDPHIRGAHIYDEINRELLFDVFIYDFGKDGIPGDNSWNDSEGDTFFTPWE